jgi:hypothetical protein
MSYRVAAIDIHKKVLIVVVASAAGEVGDAAGEALEFACRRFGAGHGERKHLIAWLPARGVQEVVMESTASVGSRCGWIWSRISQNCTWRKRSPNRAPKGRKNDFRDAKRLGRRLLAGELLLSFVPEPEPRPWRTRTRSKQQLVRDRAKLQNQREALLEEMRIKVSGVISDWLGVRGRRILKALSEGETDPAQPATPARAPSAWPARSAADEPDRLQFATLNPSSVYLAAETGAALRYGLQWCPPAGSCGPDAGSAASSIPPLWPTTSAPHRPVSSLTKRTAAPPRWTVSTCTSVPGFGRENGSPHGR